MSFNAEHVTLLNVLREVERFVNSRTCETHEVAVASMMDAGRVKVRVFNNPTQRILLVGEWYADASPDEAITIARAVLMVCGICSVEFYTVEDADSPARIKWILPTQKGDEA